MAALLCTKSESNTKTLRNCGINPKPWLILSQLKYIIQYPKKFMSMLHYLMMHIIAVMNLKCFGCVSTMSFLDACLVPVWIGVLVLGWPSQALGPQVLFLRESFLIYEDKFDSIILQQTLLLIGLILVLLGSKVLGDGTSNLIG